MERTGENCIFVKWDEKVKVPTIINPHVQASISQNMAPTPTSTGRFIAASIGLAFGCFTTYFMMKDFQLVKFEPADSPLDENGRKKRVKVSFREMQPLELTPEAAERLRKQTLEEEKLNAKKVLNKQELEQIIQEPTS